MGSSLPPARYLLRAKDLADRDFARPLDVPALARQACTSPAHFSRAFKRAFGETPHRYLMSRRVERAKALLRDSDLPVTEICLAVGFASLGSFSACFRRLVGESPTAYRRRRAGGSGARIPSCVLMMWTRPNGAVFEKRGAPRHG
ncbi:MAG TPA: helix-turn-helix transcriptional regulator [Planosporangium sp.]|jgi:transcriptional regulator GlxA family with amidase domain|nr:helix-turn-helix transcriptional regulator [Planosporangium sp.]